jgi:hypothetical protein
MPSNSQLITPDDTPGPSQPLKQLQNDYADPLRPRRPSATFNERNILPEGLKRTRISTRRQLSPPSALLRLAHFSKIKVLSHILVRLS